MGPLILRSPGMQVVGEISAAERELRAGAQIAVLDVRAHDDVARWQIEADGAPFLAVPLADLRERGEDTCLLYTSRCV